MNDIERIKQNILKQVLLHFGDFSQFLLDLGDDRYFSPCDFSIALSPFDYSILKEVLYVRQETN